MKTVVFQPIQKVWTPRTPDSNYDSLGLSVSYTAEASEQSEQLDQTADKEGEAQ